MLRENTLVSFLFDPFYLVSHQYGLWVNKNNLEDFRVLPYQYDNSNKARGLEDYYVHISFPNYILKPFEYKDALALVFEKGFYFKGIFINSRRVNFQAIWHNYTLGNLNFEYEKTIKQKANKFLETEKEFMQRQRLLFVKSYLGKI